MENLLVELAEKLKLEKKDKLKSLKTFQDRFFAESTELRY